MLVAEPRDDLGSGRGQVADPAAADALGPPIEQILGKTAGVGGKRPVEHDSGELPVPGGAVLPGGALGEPRARAERIGERPDPGKIEQATEPEPLEPRQRETSRRLGHVQQGVAAAIAVTIGVRQRSDAHAVEHDQEHAHQEFRFAAATASSRRRK